MPLHVAAPASRLVLPPRLGNPPAVRARAVSGRSRKADHDGVALVVEYHRISEGRGPYDRSPKAFLADLERLHRLGFRPVTARDWLAGRTSLPPGTSPVVMTFDDSWIHQFRMTKEGQIDPDCAVGLWAAFALRHPDFPVRGTFFAIPSMMFGQPKWTATKLRLLRDWGCEVANHTLTHPALGKMDDARVEREIGGCAVALARLGERGPFTLAYPYGSIPRHRGLLKGFRYGKARVVVPAAFVAGAGPSPMPGAKGFSRYLIPRIQAVPGPGGLDDWLGRIERGAVRPYVR